MVLRRTTEVVDWADIADRGWPSILIGNGLSRRFSKEFAYESLFREADRASGGGHSLTNEDKMLFNALVTTDFEAVLSGLANARVILDVLGLESTMLRQRYESIREAFIQVVMRIHPDQGARIPMLQRLRDAIASFKYVYTTNYDLLIYWAVMQNTSGFNDYFRRNLCHASGQWVCFSRAYARPLERSCNVLYMHGALHLYQTAWGQTVKYTHSADLGRLLDRFRSATATEGPVSPLFVSEGTADQKLATIGRSDYLSFTFDHFSVRQGPLVVFGHSIGETDAHIHQAIASWEPTTIAISLRGGSDPIAAAAYLTGLFPHHELLLFRAAGHPLADLGEPMGRPLVGTWADRIDPP